MRNLVIAALLLFTSCTFNQKVDTKHESEFCIEISEFNKILCFDQPVDTSADYIYVDEFGIKNVYSNLNLHYMMVVEIKENVVILSNPQCSISINWKGKLPKIQDMFYIISTERVLKESVLIMYPEYMLPEEEMESSDVEITEEP